MISKHRTTDILKNDSLDDGAMRVCTYRTRNRLTWKFIHRTVILSGEHEALMLDWKDEAEALKGHEQIMARLQRGEPLRFIGTPAIEGLH